MQLKRIVNTLLFFDRNGNFQHYILILGIKQSQNNIRAIAISDGKTIMDGIVDNKGNISSGYVIKGDGQKMEFGSSEAKPMFWSCMNNCLASQGVAAWAVTLLGTICAAACIGTAGLGCIFCLAGIDFIGGAVIGYCLSKCD